MRSYIYGKTAVCPAGTTATTGANLSGNQPAVYGLTFTVPAAEASALAAITAKAFDSRDQMAISTAGKTWGVTLTAGPLTHGQFGIWVQSKNQVLQLQRIVLPSA